MYTGMAIRRQLLEPGGAVEPLDLVAGALGGRDRHLQHLAGGWAPRPDALLERLAERAAAAAGGSGGGGGGGRRREGAAAAAAAKAA